MKRNACDLHSFVVTLHLVSAWASSHRVLLGQVKVADKSNEITAIPAWLELLDITGCIITIDAMGTQTEIARTIVTKGANYVLTLKANHPTLYTQVKTWFEAAHANDFKGIEFSYDQRVEAGHHRQEHRQVWAVALTAIPDLYQASAWSGVPRNLLKFVRPLFAISSYVQIPYV